MSNLCDGSHFSGYIINRKRNEIVNVDSIRSGISKNRSITAKLKNLYFTSDEVTFSSFYSRRVQKDSHTCDAWLIAGMVAYVLDIKFNKLINKDNVFNLMMLLAENLNNEKKLKKAKDMWDLRCVEKRKYTFDDTSDEECTDVPGDRLFQKFSTPKSKKSHSLDTHFETVASYSDEFNTSNNVKPIPDISGLSSDSDDANKPINNVRIKMDRDSLCLDSDDENEYVSSGKKR